MLLDGLSRTTREIAVAVGCNERTVRRVRAQLNGQLDTEFRVPPAAESPRPTGESDASSPHVEGTLSADDIGRIASLEDLLTFFKVDTSKWQVRDYRVNKWEQASKAKDGSVRIAPLYQVRANLIRSLDDQVAEIEALWCNLVADARAHAPQYTVPQRVSSPQLWASDDPCLFEVDIMDPHIGMLAWKHETGESYDSEIAVRDYGNAVQHLLRYAAHYPVTRVLFIAGNDFLHVDGPGRGGQRGGVTTAGTPQDVDSRLAKMFTTGRKALVEAIDRCRLIAPVDVIFVPGNHDAQQTYRMAEVISAWYRNDSEVDVIYGPQKRFYYSYGKNTIMFTHGEEYKRQRENLPLIMATECPAELWVASEGGAREIHTGHFHKNMQGRYTPTSDVDESRGIRSRALPSIAASDAWHMTEGYKHGRRATVIIHKQSGGVAGLHEFTL